ncbi:hypothetical protein HTZ84_21185 [Haloterrigena sp. SYSU A558-1]|uniref:Uncharacterized protein n=1 Tax=Haloterrigena gelatinilytica TaxID=2741724 RepID=A0ABX2LH56_9EURY|nr:hypothetical protein [Haloterrigena gelatinilytica]NUC74780.1 hypothetical protein [Haloterrigena gelatinilytica]
MADGDLGESVKPILALLFGLSSLAYLEIGNLEIEGFSLTDTMFTVAELDVSNATVIALSSIIMGYAVSNRDLGDFTDAQSFLAYALGGSVLLLTVSPPIHEAVVSHTELAYTVLLVQLLGFGVVAGTLDVGADGRSTAGWFN